MKGKTIGQKCKDCGNYTCPPKMTCDYCGSRNIKLVEMSGKGRISTFTTIYVTSSDYEKEAPYIVVMVELDEGPWIIGRLEMDYKKVEEIGQRVIGRRVEIFGKEFSHDYNNKKRVIPVFRLIDDPS